MTRRYGAGRLKAAALAMIDGRIAACRAAEDRYAAMASEGGGVLGNEAIARTAEATERTARFEAEMIRNFIAELPASGEP